MSVIDSTSQATAVGVGAKNVQFGISGENLTRKTVIIGTYDPAKTTVVDDVPIQVLNEADAGDKFGFGWPLHRLVKKYFEGSQGAGECWVIPQTETGTAADGEIAWTGTTTAAGTIFLRIANELYSISIPSGSTIEETSDAVVAFVNAVADTPVVAAKTAVTFETTFTSKAKGLEQNNIAITLNADVAAGEALPTGITAAVITDMANGAGTPDIQTALDGMGTGDDANQQYFTHLVHGYGLVTSELDKIAIYVGLGNDFTGCYSKLVTRPFTSLNCDTDPGSAALTALQVITDARLTDRANGILGVPDEDEIPTEIAAFATGLMARVSQNNPAQHFADQILTGVGKRSTSANRWTKNYSDRDIAVKAGISPTKVISEQAFMQNVVTFYRPASVPTGSNGYKSMRSIAVLQDITNKLRETFEAEAWQGISIVADASTVTDFAAKQKTRDILDVQTTLNNLANFFESKGWIFDAAFAQENSEVTIRAGSNGFDINFKWKMSGEAQIYNIQSSFDINIAS
jgi:phage tail sheath gpL-like